MASAATAALSKLDATMAPIKRLTVLALKLPDAAVEAFVEAWRDELASRLDDRASAVPLLYSANDILQESKRLNDGGSLLFTTMQRVLPDALDDAASCDPASLPRIARTIAVWEDRSVFDQAFLNMLKERLHLGASAVVSAPAARADDATRLKRSATEMLSSCIEDLPIEHLYGLLKSEGVKVEPPTDEQLAEWREKAENCDLVYELSGLLKEVQRELKSLQTQSAMIISKPMVATTLRNKLESLVSRLESDLSSAAAELGVTATLEDVLNDDTLQETYTTTTTTTKLVPKSFIRDDEVERARKAEEERKRREKERAERAERPMMYDKRLKKYVPLPSMDADASWREH